MPTVHQQALLALLHQASGDQPSLIEGLLSAQDAPQSLADLAFRLLVQRLPEAQRSLLSGESTLTNEERQALLNGLPKTRSARPALVADLSVDPMRRTVRECLKALDVSKLGTAKPPERLEKAFRAMARYLHGDDRERFITAVLDEITAYLTDYHPGTKSVGQRMDDVVSLFSSKQPIELSVYWGMTRVHQWRDEAMRHAASDRKSAQDGQHAMHGLEKITLLVFKTYQAMERLMTTAEHADQHMVVQENIAETLSVGRSLHGESWDYRFYNILAHAGMMAQATPRRHWDDRYSNFFLNPETVGRLLGDLSNLVGSHIASEALPHHVRQFDQLLHALENSKRAEIRDFFLPRPGKNQAHRRSAQARREFCQGLSKHVQSASLRSSLMDGILWDTPAPTHPSGQPKIPALSINQLLVNLDVRQERQRQEEAQRRADQSKASADWSERMARDAAQEASAVRDGCRPSRW